MDATQVNSNDDDMMGQRFWNLQLSEPPPLQSYRVRPHRMSWLNR